MQTIDVDLLGIGGVLVLHLTVTRCTEIGLRHIEAEQTVEVIGHGLREFDEFLVAFLVRHGNLVLHWDGEVLAGFILVLIVFFIDFVYFNFLFALDVDVGVVYLSLHHAVSGKEHRGEDKQKSFLHFQ